MEESEGPPEGLGVSVLSSESHDSAAGLSVTGSTGGSPNTQILITNSTDTPSARRCHRNRK